MTKIASIVIFNTYYGPTFSLVVLKQGDWHTFLEIRTRSLAIYTRFLMIAMQTLEIERGLR